MATETAAAHAPGFSRLFDFPRHRQVLAYRDSRSTVPAMVVMACSGGVLATSRLTVGKDAPSPEQAPAHARLLGEMLDRFTPQMAQDVLQSLDAVVDKHLPDVQLLGFLRDFLEPQTDAFARLHHEGSLPVLVLREQDKGAPVLRVISPEAEQCLRFSSKAERDQLFAATPQALASRLDPAWGAALLPPDAHAPAQAAPLRARSPGSPGA